MEMAGFNKIGPWGGNGGIEYVMETVPHRLESITIYSSVVVDSLEFSYSEVNGDNHTSGPWGSASSESSQMIRLGSHDFLREVSGTVGPFNSMPNVITSLKFFTNGGTYGPFGQGGGTPFKVDPLEYSSNIVGFFGRAEQCLETFGIYIRKF
ncbi:hypothetical protein OsJ_02022 [Oryza sativa Japonica Group]|uniref:Jacalin-type lectin domain-containing protein n=2 Tax=Oryza sativa subsp. japonica TaxID=39947 RepID=A0A8J8Y6T4_ORYSJ|nr:Jacalin-like lectin domain containing protein [Oryza sativa Japonica Group]EAZ12139.1 hypothetical protein OsJ_02022 [Oryza sativa Japonica Group]